MQPGGGAEHITVEDMFQAWAEQEKVDANHRFFAMIKGKVVDGEDPVDEHLYFIPKLSAAVGKQTEAVEADADDQS